MIGKQPSQAIHHYPKNQQWVCPAGSHLSLTLTLLWVSIPVIYAGVGCTGLLCISCISNNRMFSFLPCQHCVSPTSPCHHWHQNTTTGSWWHAVDTEAHGNIHVPLLTWHRNSIKAYKAERHMLNR